jgi:hypothetical protein
MACTQIVSYICDTCGLSGKAVGEPGGVGAVCELKENERIWNRQTQLNAEPHVLVPLGQKSESPEKLNLTRFVKT